jgi:hypothetical protein
MARMRFHSNMSTLEAVRRSRPFSYVCVLLEMEQESFIVHIGRRSVPSVRDSLRHRTWVPRLPFLISFWKEQLSRYSDEPGFNSRKWEENFLCSTASRPSLGPTLLSIQWALGVLSLGVWRPEREAHHSTTSNGGKKVELYLNLTYVCLWRST